MTKLITLFEFENEQWNHVEDHRKKYFVWVHGDTLKPLEAQSWIEEHCEGRYFCSCLKDTGYTWERTGCSYYRIWFELWDDAVLFGLAYGEQGTPNLSS